MMDEMLILKLKNSSGPGNAEWIMAGSDGGTEARTIVKIPTENDYPGIAGMADWGDCAATSHMSLKLKSLHHRALLLCPVLQLCQSNTSSSLFC